MLLNLTDKLVYGLFGLDPTSRFGGAVHFFIYDTVKIFLLLAVMIFCIGVVRTWLPEQRLRRWMSAGGIWGNLVAALFGAITPFCSCSSIPIFISLLKAGVPLGVTFSFLITSPIINEYLVVLMASEFGVPVTIAYVASGLTIGTVAGTLLGRMRLEHLLEADMVAPAAGITAAVKHTLVSRLRYGWKEAASVIRQIWVWVLVGVALGAIIHNYVPQESIHHIMEVTGIFSVPIATLLGVPMYGSCAAIVPVAVVLFGKGIPLGTALAFMMAMAALSLPEAIMLRRVMRLGLIGIYFSITTTAIILTGYLLNALAPTLVPAASSPTRISEASMIKSPTDYTYVASYFDGQDASGLRLAGSDDGFAWESIPVDFNPSVGDWQIFRDPSFARGPDGVFHLVWTTGSNGFGYARSSDLLNWEDVRFIKVNRGPLAGNPKFCWAPEILWDDDSAQFIIIFSIGMNGREGGGWRADFKSYYVTTVTFDTFSEPRLLFDPHPAEFFDIDASIVAFNGRWYAFYKIEDGILATPEKDKDGIHWATAPSPTGPWSDFSTGRLPGNQANSEGPSPIVIGDQLVVFYDLTPGLKAAVTRDGKQWEDVSGRIQQPPNYRHGTIRKLR